MIQLLIFEGDTKGDMLIYRPYNVRTFDPQCTVIDNPTTRDTGEIGHTDGAQNALIVIALGDGKYACNNVTTPDKMTVNGIASFPDEEEATIYMASQNGMRGSFETKNFEEIREIAKSKPVLQAVLLMKGAKVVDIHFVR